MQRRFLSLSLFLMVLPAACWFAVTSRASVTAPDAADEFSLTLFHTNDLHGHLFPFAYTEIGRSVNEQPSVGGAARRGTLLRSVRRGIRNPTLLIDAGDTFTRGPLTNAYEGLADVEAMNALGYDLAAIGNNEFKAKDATEINDAAGSQAALLQVVKHARFPWICANATDARGAVLEGVQPYVVRLINGVRVGFLGLTAPRSATYPQTKGWTIADPITTAQKWVPEVRRHCDILIAVTHIGFDLDKELAAKVSGIDAIVGGDSHTFLYAAEVVVSPQGVKVPIVQDGEFGVNLGRFDLHFTHNAAGGWSLTRYEYALLPVGPDLWDLKEVADVLAPFRKPFDGVVGEIEKVGATPEERTRLTSQIFADAMCAGTGADLALMPNGEGLYEVFRNLNVTRYDIYSIEPFKNHVVMAKLTGREIAALQAKVKDTLLSSAGMNLLPDKTYRVAFMDYIAQDSYQLKETQITDTGHDVREIVAAYLGRKRQSPP